MAFLTPSARIQFGGRLYGDAEIWTCTLGLHDWAGGSTLVQPSVIAPTIRDWFTSGDTGISSDATLDFVKLNQIDAQGHYLDQTTTHEFYWPTPQPKGGVTQSGSNAKPFAQLTICISLTTSARRGPASQGRFFMPLPAVGANAAGHINAASLTALVGTTTTMIENINALLGNGSGWAVSVLSDLGAARHVTGVRVGSVMDTQRRRRNKIPEEYFSGPVENAKLDPGQVTPVGGGIGGQV